MTANEIRQSFFDFFKEKQHTIVPSASLLPQSPGLLFTNAGMNQFVPYFLGTEKAPYSPPRAADTQKCIRAGGKHNDLDDVGYDTYHHTMFEMLGNWSFGDYFKAEAIQWSWEYIVERLGFPAARLYASVYRPDKSLGDPSEFDQEAYDLWAKLFESKGLNPKKHIVGGNKADNFWMMGETGPCGPCSELHVDLTPNGDSEGKLVNMDSDLCIEIWNLVFIQYNAEADGTLRDLPSKHVDTGMGFERACSIYQGTKGFTDFSKKPSNYATDVFTPIFAKLEELSGKQYNDIYPESVEVNKSTLSAEMKEAVAFRVIADHIRTLSFSIADRILPGNTGRNYVLRRILRRAVRYGRTLGFDGNSLFLTQLVDPLVNQMQGTFPEMDERREAIKETLTREEKSFNRTLDRGLNIFDKETQKGQISGDFAFALYDTYGFPIDLTELLCQERQLVLDKKGFEKRMDEARTLSQAAQKKTVVRALDRTSDVETVFTGYDEDSSEAKILEIHRDDESLLVITDRSPFYVEMGGQLGDLGFLKPYKHGEFGETIEVTSVQKIGQAIAHEVSQSAVLRIGDTVSLTIDSNRRRKIEAHHTATHLLHWALHEVVSSDATQQGSLVTTNRLRFDCVSGALTAQQRAAIEDKVNEKIKAGDGVFYNEVPHADVKNRKDIMQFFGDKYGETVRVVQIGGNERGLDGYAMELCGGTHIRTTSDIGIFKITSETAIASGVRRIEAVCGVAADDWERAVAVKRTKLIKAKLDGIGASFKTSTLTQAYEDAADKLLMLIQAFADDAGKTLMPTHAYKDAVDKLITQAQACEDATNKLRKSTQAYADAAGKTTDIKVDTFEASTQAYAEAEDKLITQAQAFADAADKLLMLIQASLDAAGKTLMPTHAYKDAVDKLITQAQAFADAADKTLMPKQASLDAADKLLKQAQASFDAADKLITQAQACEDATNKLLKQAQAACKTSTLTQAYEDAADKLLMLIQAFADDAGKTLMPTHAYKDAVDKLITQAQAACNLHKQIEAFADAEIKLFTQAQAFTDATIKLFTQAQAFADATIKLIRQWEADAAAAMADAALVGLLEKGGNIAEIFEGPANMLQELLNGLKKKQFTGAGFMIVDDGNRLHLGAFCGSDAISAGLQANKLIQELSSIAGGKGGGKPNQARGGAPQRDKANELLTAAQEKLSIFSQPRD